MYNFQKFDKKDIAIIFLKRAQKSFEEKDYFSALHLAGASEEIFGTYLNKQGLENSLETEINASIEFCKYIYKKEQSPKDTRTFLTRSKNAIKHMNDLNDCYVNLDPAEEARMMIIRALTNLWRLGETTSEFEEFWLTIERCPPRL